MRTLITTSNISLDDLIRNGGLTSDHIQFLSKWLLAQRLQNYGYDNKDFKKMINKAAYLRRKLRKSMSTKATYGLYNRVIFMDKGGIEYQVGQSFNEEYISLLECLTEGKN